MVAVIGMVVWGLSLVAPALADEFEVAIVLGDDVDRTDFMDGFQGAVDASPDVSHPLDSEGGDHLGSMDVTIVLLDLRSDDVTNGAAAVADSGSPIVVVDVPTEEIDAITAEAAASGAMLLAFTDAVPPRQSNSESLLVITRDRAETMAPSLSPSFEADFAAAYNRPPSPAAARGYTAGRLVDIAVEETDRDPTDVATLMAAFESTTGMQGATAPVPTTLTSSSDPTSPETVSRAIWSIPAGLIAVAIVVLLIVVRRSIRRTGRSTSRDSD